MQRFISLQSCTALHSTAHHNTWVLPSWHDDHAPQRIALKIKQGPHCAITDCRCRYVKMDFMMAIMIIMLSLMLTLAARQPQAGLYRLCCMCCALSQQPAHAAKSAHEPCLRQPLSWISHGLAIPPCSVLLWKSEFQPHKDEGHRQQDPHHKQGCDPPDDTCTKRGPAA